MHMNEIYQAFLGELFSDLTEGAIPAERNRQQNKCIKIISSLPPFTYLYLQWNLGELLKHG